MKTADIKFIELCEEIDYWKSEAKYYKEKYKESERKYSKSIDDSIKRSRQTCGQFLSIALHMKESPEGGLAISKDDRKSLVEDLERYE